MGNEWTDGPGQKRRKIKNKAPVYRGQARGSQNSGAHKKKDGCAGLALALLGGGAALLLAAAAGAVELVRAVF